VVEFAHPAAVILKVFYDVEAHVSNSSGSGVRRPRPGLGARSTAADSSRKAGMRRPRPVTQAGKRYLRFCSEVFSSVVRCYTSALCDGLQIYEETYRSSATRFAESFGHALALENGVIFRRVQVESFFKKSRNTHWSCETPVFGISV
jgi:hypothetical protein